MLHRPWMFTLAAILVCAPAAHACIEDMKFVNKTGVACNDLHIVFNRGVDITNAGAFADNSAQNGNGTHDLDGGSVANDGNTKIDITSSPCNNIQVKKWWWTNNGNLEGGEHQGEPKATVAASGGNAGGGGVIRVSLNGVHHFFNTIPGAPPAGTIAQFNAFLSSILGDTGFPAIRPLDAQPTSVVFAGNVLGDPALMLQCQLMSPDPNQTLLVGMGTTAVPGASPKGVAALAVGLLAVSALVLIERRRRLAA